MPIIDQMENSFEEDMIFLEDVGNRLFRTLLHYFHAEDALYWVFGWMTGQAATLAMWNFPEPVTTTVTQAMHFQRGLHFLSVRAAEMIVPIPLLEDGQPDWRIVQEVVYDIKRVQDEFEARGLYPVDLALEARFMAGSELLLAAQHGNQASLAIEAASSPLVPVPLWLEFKVK